jgi:hypothetical protein
MTSQAYQRREAAIRHEEIRELVYEVVKTELIALFPLLHLTSIDDGVIDEIGNWRKAWLKQDIDRKPKWDCVLEWRRIARREKRFEVAIWSHDRLCGVAFGRISRRRIVANIHFLESTPVNNPFRSGIGRIAARCLVRLAQELGCERVAIVHPVSSLIDFYRKMGFTQEDWKNKKLVKLWNQLSIVSSMLSDPAWNQALEVNPAPSALAQVVDSIGSLD